MCPLGPFYLPAYGPGVRAGLAELAPHLLGEDPTALARINRTMNAALKGHPYVKSPIDIACWDILGKVTSQPVSTLLGGTFGEDFVLYRAISQDLPENMAGRVAGYREEGYRRFQLKVGGDPEVDIARIHAVAAELGSGDILIADANTGWLPHEAARVCRGVRDVDVYIEQPCLGYRECLSVRRHHTDHPFVLDESIDDLNSLLRANADLAMDVVNIKISKFGGITAARAARDLCVSLGIGMTIEDSWGGDVTTAAIAHLAHSTPEALLFTATDFNSYVTVSTCTGAPQRDHGRMRGRVSSRSRGSNRGGKSSVTRSSKRAARHSEPRSDTMRLLPELFRNNEAWARARAAEDPAFFNTLVEAQEPDYLWIGCADSRVPANLVVGLGPGELFVHRKRGESRRPRGPELSCGRPVRGRIAGRSACDRVWALWVWGNPGRTRPPRSILSSSPGCVRSGSWQRPTAQSSRPSARGAWRRLCELNVAAQVASACRMPAITRAWKEGSGPAVHGWIFDPADGRLRDLGLTRTAESG